MVSTRELDTRTNDGIQIRLLWCEGDGRLSVTVLDTKTGASFSLDVREGERPLDVFHHPYAYAAHHDINTRPECPRRQLAASLAS